MYSFYILLQLVSSVISCCNVSAQTKTCAADFMPNNILCTVEKTLAEEDDRSVNVICGISKNSARFTIK